MPRSYRNISMYEQEIIWMKLQGKTLRESRPAKDSVVTEEDKHKIQSDLSPQG